MRGEEHLPADDLLHLGSVAMRQQAIGREVLVNRSEVQGLPEATAGARHARRGIDHDAGRLQQAGTDQGRQGQPGGRRVAAGGGDEGRPRQSLAEQLGQPVDGLGQQLGCAVFLAVPLGVQRSVLQTEVGGEVHDEAHPRPQLRDDPLGLPVGQAAEHQVETVETGGVVVLVDQTGIGGGQRRRVGADGLAGVGMGRGHGDLELGVTGEQSQQLRPGVPRRPKDPCLHRMSIHTSAYSCEPSRGRHRRALGARNDGPGERAATSLPRRGAFGQGHAPA